MNSNSELNWYESQWLYRAEINITSNSGSALVNYTIKIQLTSEFNYSLAQTNGEDIRITDDSDVILSHWIERWNENRNSTIWVKMPEILPDSISIIYMYYGNPSASPTSNGGDVFSYFDDFESQDYGEEPEGWYIKQREWGSFKINDNARIGSGCCYYIDNSTDGSCRFYRQLSENIIGRILEFWIKPVFLSDSGILCYNDGNDSYIGGNTYFGHSQSSAISYNDGAFQLLYFPYQAENWYYFSVQLESTSSYSQFIYDSNGSLLVSARDLPYLGSPIEINYIMNGGHTAPEMKFYIDAIRYREYVSDEPSVEIIDYQQIMPTETIPTFSITIEMIAFIIITFIGISYIYKKTKKE
ncbi:MAG: DUF2341 domain-containing protein [Candidatus Heimdallarchaeota archaeon]|nr:DUF2341 domain-containing protein [Candidatus Heimdallarchaeota archaeon]